MDLGDPIVGESRAFLQRFKQQKRGESNLQKSVVRLLRSIYRRNKEIEEIASL